VWMTGGKCQTLATVDRCCQSRNSYLCHDRKRNCKPPLLMLDKIRFRMYCWHSISFMRWDCTLLRLYRSCFIFLPSRRLLAIKILLWLVGRRGGGGGVLAAVYRNTNEGYCAQRNNYDWLVPLCSKIVRIATRACLCLYGFCSFFADINI
jgi:hypothetical protein